MSQVPIYKDCSAEQFRKELQPARRPVVLRGLDVGECVAKWNRSQYLTRKVNSQIRFGFLISINFENYLIEKIEIFYVLEMQK